MKTHRRRRCENQRRNKRTTTGGGTAEGKGYYSSPQLLLPFHLTRAVLRHRAVPGCPRVVRKIPRTVFIQLRGRRVTTSSTISLLSSLLFSFLPRARPTLISATIFSSFRNRLRAFARSRGQWSAASSSLSSCDRARSARKRSHRSPDQRTVTRAVSSFLRGSLVLARELLSKEPFL